MLNVFMFVLQNPDGSPEVKKTSPCTSSAPCRWDVIKRYEKTFDYRMENT